MSTNGKPKSKRKPPALLTAGGKSRLWRRVIIGEYARLRSFPGVRSVSIGAKEVGGRITRQLCVKIYVEHKFESSAAAHRLPSSTTLLFPAGSGIYKARRVRTDVVEVGSIRLIANPTSRLDPLPLGAQIGFALGAGGAGTLGCWVVKSGLSHPAFLTAGHVLSSRPGPVQAGQAVYQPQPPFPSSEFDPLIIGQTAEGHVGNDPSADGYLDYAAVSLSTGERGMANTSVESCTSSRGAHLSLEEILAEKTAIRKYGAKTRCTEGVFSAFHAHFADTNGATFDNILEFSSSSPGLKIAAEGDSGSLIVSRSPQTEGAAVGLLFGVAANDDTRAFVVPFERLAGLGFRVS
jgi:hypothetical protein